MQPIAVAATILLMSTLCGCSPDAVAPGTPAPTVGSASPLDGEHDPDPEETYVSDNATVVPVPKADATSQSDAIAAAERTITAFARPQLPYEQWIADLYPLLTQNGAAAHEDTDPSIIPAHTLTGPGTVLPRSTDLALIVQVPTDAGSYNVSLSRPTTTAPWLADQIRPAES
jgi:hypothetical protein